MLRVRVAQGVVQPVLLLFLFLQSRLRGTFLFTQRGQFRVAGIKFESAQGAGKAQTRGQEGLFPRGAVPLFLLERGQLGAHFAFLLQPAQHPAHFFLFAGQRGVLVRGRPAPGAQFGLFFRGKNLQPRQLRLQFLVPCLFPVQARVGAFGNMGIDVGSGNLFQNRGALGGRGIEKGGEAPLRQQHGTGKAVKIQPGKFRDLCGGFGGSVFQNFAVFRVFGDVGYLVGIGLERSARSASCAVLIPGAAVTARSELKFHFSGTFPRASAHDVVEACAQASQAGCLAIQRQTYRVEQGAFARPGGAGNGKDALVRIFGEVEVNGPFSEQ